MISCKGTHSSVWCGGCSTTCIHIITHSALCHFYYVYTFCRYLKVTSGAIPCTSDLYSKELIVALITVFGL